MITYRIAGIDVHKKMLAVAVTDVAEDGAFQFQRRRFATTPDALQQFAAWLCEQHIQEAVMESTAQYWKPVWAALERYWIPRLQTAEATSGSPGRLYLAQAKSNRAPNGRKNDFADAERLVKRQVAQELILSFVPSPEQRLWRTITRRKLQLMRARIRLQNQLESFLEEAHIKLSSLVSDLLGQSGRRMLQALAAGEDDPEVLAALGDRRLRATPQQLCDALGACRELHPVYRELLNMSLRELALLEEQMEQLDRAISGLLEPHQSVIQRLAEVPGLGVNSAHQIIAEIGPAAAVFSSAKHLASWVGVCPGEEESAGVSQSHRSPKGNRNMRRILDQAANAAVKVKGSVFDVVFRRLRARGLPYKKAIWAIAHRLCRLIWLILQRGLCYEERGPAVSAKSKRNHAVRMIRELTRMGYRIHPPLDLDPA